MTRMAIQSAEFNQLAQFHLFAALAVLMSEPSELINEDWYELTVTREELIAAREALAKARGKS